jgi:imidazolonepropionase-like amidohydrolase
MAVPVLFKNARVFDGHAAECAEGMNLLVADGLIREVSAQPIVAEGAQVVDVGGRTLMPGLIDCHIHAFTCDVNAPRQEAVGDTYRAAHAIRMLRFALDCGFTTVRDIGGGHYGLYKALADNLVVGPRYFYAGKILSMTGGHGDFRQMEEPPRYRSVCGCSSTIFNSICVIADGVDECIKAAREELRQGAHCIKLMGSGGVFSPSDPIWMNQYREDEIRAIVRECTERRTYAAAHCHTASSLSRCVEYGVRCIEHGTLIDAPTANYVAQRGAFIVPTMTIIEQLVETGQKMGFAKQSQAKAAEIWKAAISGLDIMRNAGVKICFGTDLLGDLYTRQCREFTLRKEVFTPLELLRQATSVAAEMMMLEGQIGCVRSGALADLLVVDGDPLKDISLLESNGQKLAVICRGGELVKNTLH